MMLAAALVVLAANSCNKDNISDAPAQDSMVVKFTANVAGTKAVFNPSSFEDGAAVPVLWKTGDKLRMYVKEKVLSKLPDVVEVNLPDGAEYSESATWTHDFKATYDGEKIDGYVPEAPFTFYAFCPGASMRGFYSGSQQRIRVDTVPSEQTPEQNSCDPKAMCLCSISEAFEEWPEEVEMPAFRHMTAYGCLTLGSGIPEDAVVTKVMITANEGQYLAGDAFYYYAGENEGKWEDFSNNSRTETITINTASKENIWFGCCPTTALESLTFEVYTAAGDCYAVEKTISGKNFEAGKVAKMTVTGFEKVETLSEVTYTFDANSLFELIGGTYTNETLKTATSGSYPSLSWNADATLIGDKESVKAVVVSSNDVTRLKFNAGFDGFTFTLTPEEGWIVDSFTIFTKYANEKYNLQATIGEKELLNKSIGNSDQSNFVRTNGDAVAGPLQFNYTRKPAEASTGNGSLYINSLTVTLKKQ